MHYYKTLAFFPEESISWPASRNSDNFLSTEKVEKSAENRQKNRNKTSAIPGQ